MKRRWRLALLVGGLAAATILTPILYIESSCSSPLPRMNANAAYAPRVTANARRPEARTWLTYPEWHIVYSADSLGRYLTAEKPPSGYAYGADIGGFWRAYCQVNRATSALGDAGDAKVMIYTIGISFTVEMAVKAAYERTLGRLFEWVSGWTSTIDTYSANVQTRYGAFMHETPWYAFAFGEALGGLWGTRATGQYLRHWERRLALSAEYGVKAIYAKLIGAASGATLGRDELTLRFIARATPQQIAAIDPRLKPVASKGALTAVEAPRYAQFSALLGKMAAANVPLIEIAGNDDIFLTALIPDGRAMPGTVPLLAMPLGDRPGWQRVGFTVKVRALLPTMCAIAAGGGEIEHVYDY